MHDIYISANHEWKYRHFDTISQSEYNLLLESPEKDTLQDNINYFSSNKNNPQYQQYASKLKDAYDIIQDKLGLLLEISTPKLSKEGKEELFKHIFAHQIQPENMISDGFGNYVFKITIQDDSIGYLFNKNVEDMSKYDRNKPHKIGIDLYEYCKENEKEYLEVYPFEYNLDKHNKIKNKIK